MTHRSERLHGLDAVRGYALLLGVVFHATMSFLPGSQVWVVQDVARSPALSVLFFVSHIFRMTTFFLIAGFFAHMMVGRRGVRGFAVDRLKRIALPLVAFWPISIAGIALGAGYAVYVATGVFPTKPPPGPPAPLGSFPFTHLWFLYVLLLLYVAVLGLRALVHRLDASERLRAGADRAVAALVASPFAPVVLAAPVAVALYLQPEWRAWFGLPTPDSNVVPNLPAAVQFFAAFALGFLIHRQPRLMEVWTRRWPLNLAVAIALTAGCLAWLGFTPVVTPFPPGSAKLAYAAAYAVAVWAWTFAVIGLALRFLADESPVRRYIADSSYWIYLIHLPVVIFLQAWISRFTWPWEVKFAVVLGVGFAIMFASYQLVVRHTLVGAILNGRRAPRPAAAPTAHPETAR